VPFPSLYRAKAASVQSGIIQAFVPQVFGETPITITESLGPMPDATTMGWVFFQAGDADFPVWASGLGTGSAVPDEVWIGPDTPLASALELWYDTDAVAPLPAAANVTFTPTGTIAATNTQAAVAEVATDAAAALTAAIATATADVPWIRISTLGFTSGWVDYGAPYGPAYYRKKDGDVQLRGLISTGTAGVITTLPVGYRPQYEPIFAVDIQSGIAEVRVATSGTVSITAIPGFTLMSSWTSLANVTFSTI
jgi:hypothetical protein